MDIIKEISLYSDLILMLISFLECSIHNPIKQICLHLSWFIATKVNDPIGF